MNLTVSFPARLTYSVRRAGGEKVFSSKDYAKCKAYAHQNGSLIGYLTINTGPQILAEFHKTGFLLTVELN